MDELCNGKVRYTKGRALAVLASRRKKTTKRLRVYECDLCYDFYLTSSEKL